MFPRIVLATENVSDDGARKTVRSLCAVVLRSSYRFWCHSCQYGKNVDRVEGTGCFNNCCVRPKSSFKHVQTYLSCSWQASATRVAVVGKYIFTVIFSLRYQVVMD